MAYSPQIGQNIGLEVEVAGLTESGARLMVERSGGGLRGFAIHHDGSVNRPGFQIAGLVYPVKEYKVLHDNRTFMSSFVGTTQMGSEIVSGIIDTSNPNWLQPIEVLMDWLIQKGHEVPNIFCSTHVHVSAAGLPLFVLKNLLRIWRFIEAPMFRLACAEMGFHRGFYRKDYAYCRPMSSPLVVFDQNGGMRPSFNIDHLLKAENLNQFFLGYGACNPQTEPIRWHPARYAALNLLPLLTYGTVEFRIFNETLNARTIWAWVELCKAIVTTALTSKGLADDEYPHLPLGYSGSFDLGMFQTLFELPNKVMSHLEYLWGLADWQPFTVFPLVNSNNDNYQLSWASLDEPTVPPLIDGQSVMMYAPLNNGRHSEDHVYVFHSHSTYRAAMRTTPIPVEEGRALVLANFRQEEPTNELTDEAQEGSIATRRPPRFSLSELERRVREAEAQRNRDENAPTPVDPETVSTSVNPTLTQVDVNWGTMRVNELGGSWTTTSTARFEPEEVQPVDFWNDPIPSGAEDEPEHEEDPEDDDDRDDDDHDEEVN